MLNQITDIELYSLYWDDGLSGKAIAKLFGCSPALVCRRMKASGIPTRSCHDYPPTDKQKQSWVENGKRLSQYSSTIASRGVGGKKNKGRRRREYEFGGHEKKRGDGYIKVYVPDHPHATSDGYVMKHVLVMERKIGRFLNPDEVVHHINHIRDDNRIENLTLMTKHDHMSMHMIERHAERRKNNAKQCDFAR